MTQAPISGSPSAGCVVSHVQRNASTNFASPQSPHRSLSFPSPQCPHRSLSFPNNSDLLRRSDGSGQIMKTSIRIPSASNILTQTAPRHASCFPPRTCSDLMSAKKCSSNIIRLASHSPCPGREACHGIMNELESETLQVNLDSKLNALEKTFLENAKLQSLAWQADFDGRLLALEQLKKDYSNKVAMFENMEDAKQQSLAWQAGCDRRLLTLEQHKEDYANKAAMFEDMEDAKQQSLAWQAGFDRRLLTLEQHKQDYSNKVVPLEERLSVIEECIATLLELGEVKGQEHTKKVSLFQDRLSVIEESTANFLKLSESNDQQHRDLKEEVAKLKIIVCEIEENLGLSCVPEAIDPAHVEQKRHNNNLTVPPEDRNDVLSKSVGGISLAHDREHLLEHGPDKQIKASPTTTLTHRLCVVECHIDMIASILKHIEAKFSSLNGQVLTSSEVKSKGERVMRKRSAGKSNNSRDTLWISQEARESYDKITMKDQHSQMQLMLARASKHLDEAVPLDARTLSWTCSTIIEESDTAAEMPTN